jgi:nucleotide-binding universal stress UspA family protein
MNEEEIVFRRLLVPVDLTPKNARAVEVARDLALQSGGEVFLLHVIETLDLPFEELEDFYDRLQAKATDAMRPHAEVLDAAGVSASGHILYGKRHEKVLEFAEEHGADLIILDSHRIEPKRPGRGFATLSYRIAITASCPVLLVKGAPAARDNIESPGGAS